MVGDTLVLVIHLASGPSALVTETDPAWATLLEALPRSLPGAARAAAWTVQAVATDQPVDVFRR